MKIIIFQTFQISPNLQILLDNFKGNLKNINNNGEDGNINSDRIQEILEGKNELETSKKAIEEITQVAYAQTKENEQIQTGQTPSEATPVPPNSININLSEVEVVAPNNVENASKLNQNQPKFDFQICVTENGRAKTSIDFEELIDSEDDDQDYGDIEDDDDEDSDDSDDSSDHITEDQRLEEGRRMFSNICRYFILLTCLILLFLLTI